MASTSEQAREIPVDELRAQLNGELITAEEPAYDEARQVSSRGSTSGRSRSRGSPGPRMSQRWSARRARAASSSPSAAAATAAPGTDRRRRARHRPLRDERRRDRRRRRAAWVETGATAGEYTLATGEQGLATGLGDTGSVGIGGITLAGGIGFMVRKSGLTIDNLLSAEVVTADGEIVQASEDSSRTCSGRSAAAAATSASSPGFQLRLAEVAQIVGGMLILPASPQVITGFLESAHAAPEELSTIANVMLAPPMPFLPEDAHGKPVLMGQFAYAGPVDRGEQALAPFRALAEPIADMVRPMRYPELFRAPSAQAPFMAGANFFADTLERGGGRGDPEQLPKSTAPMGPSSCGCSAARWRASRTTRPRSRIATERLFVNIAAIYLDAAEDGHPRRLGQRRRGLAGQGRSGRLRRLPRRGGRATSARPTPARPGTGFARSSAATTRTTCSTSTTTSRRRRGKRAVRPTQRP